MLTAYFYVDIAISQIFLSKQSTTTCTKFADSIALFESAGRYHIYTRKNVFIQNDKKKTFSDVLGVCPIFIPLMRSFTTPISRPGDSLVLEVILYGIISFEGGT